MKVAESKTAATAQHSQANRQAEQPFFQRQLEGGQSAFFGKQTETPTAFFQPKLKIGAPNDHYEQQADAVADQVVAKLNTPTPLPPTPKGSTVTPPTPKGSTVTPPTPKGSTVTPPTSKGSTVTPPTSSKGSTGIQAKCDHCAQVEKLQKKDEERGQVGEQVQMKPIFDSAAESPPDGSVQRKCADCEKEEAVQRKTVGNTEGVASSDLSSRLSASKGGGQPLPADTRTSMESAMGADFSNVRVHTGGEAVQMSQDINAQAFTHGSDVYFNKGKFNPSNTEGVHLLAHELTHTVQQGSAHIRRLPAEADYRITNVFGGANHPNSIFFAYNDATIPASQIGKITPLANPVDRQLTLVGKASEDEGLPAVRSTLVDNRITAVNDALTAGGHTGVKTPQNEHDSGAGSTRYTFKRQVEIIPAGIVSNDVDCALHPNPAIDCAATYPNYANFPNWMTTAEARVQAGIAFLTGTRTAAQRVLMRRFFGTSSWNTSRRLTSNLRALLRHLQTDVRAHHACHNLCDASCAGGSIAHNRDTGASARKVLCPSFFNGITENERVETLIHESVHGSRGNLDGPPDFAYRWMRLFGSATQNVAIDTDKAIRNPDSLTFFLREVGIAGSTNLEVVADENFNAGMTAPQQREAFVALGWLEWWLVRDKQLIEQVYSLSTTKSRNGDVNWGLPINNWSSLIIRSSHNHFATSDYPHVPNLDDRIVYTGISNRLAIMREHLIPRQTFNVVPAGNVVWDTVNHTVTLPSTFFALSLVNKIKALLTALAQNTAGVSAAILPHYPDFANDVRRADSVGP